MTISASVAGRGTSLAQLVGKAGKLGQNFARGKHLQTHRSVGDGAREFVAATLEWNRPAGSKRFDTAAKIFRRKFGAELHITAEITRMAGRGENFVDERREFEFSACLIGIEQFEAVRGRAPDVHKMRVKIELLRQCRTA